MQTTAISTKLYSQETAAIFADFERFLGCTSKTHFGANLDEPVFSFIRNPRCKGAFLPERYSSVDGETRHGIAVNSKYCQSIGDDACMDLLAFLFVQLARRDLGPKGRNGKHGTPGYIDSWSHDSLARMGLQTFVEDSEDQRELGYGLSVRRVENGPFDLMCRELVVSGFRFRWHENAANVDTSRDDGKTGVPPEQKEQTRARYVCPECELKALAKPNAKLICGVCNLLMEASEPTPKGEPTRSSGSI